MTLTQLTYFIEVARAQHLTRTAEKLHVSAPALSNSLKALEKELGIPLFRREKGHIYLSEAGELFLPYAVKAVQAVREGTDQLESVLRNEKAAVKIGIVSPSMFLSQRDETRALFEKYEINQAEIQPYQNESILWDLDLDFIVTGHDYRGNELLKWRNIMPAEDPMVLAVPPDYVPSVEYGRVHSLKEFESCTFYLHERNTVMRIMEDDLFHKNHFHPYMTITMDDISIPKIIRNGNGVSFATVTLPHYVDYYHGIPILRLKELEQYGFRNRAYWRAEKGLTPAAADVLETFCRTAENISNEIGLKNISTSIQP